MNRRNFFGNLLAVAAGFAILPPATTYSRIWRAEKKLAPLPDFSFNPKDFMDQWRFYVLPDCSWTFDSQALPLPESGERGLVDAIFLQHPR